jgi:hypothetical protein
MSGAVDGHVCQLIKWSNSVDLGDRKNAQIKFNLLTPSGSAEKVLFTHTSYSCIAESKKTRLQSGNAIKIRRARGMHAKTYNSDRRL